MGALFCFPILCITLYGQIFYLDLLPKLETVIQNYERREVLAIRKCQQAQMSNFAIAVTFYSLVKTKGVCISKVDARLGHLLTTLFGKDSDSMQKAMKLIICKVPSLSPHKITEIEKSLEEANNFFLSIGYMDGIEIINQLDRKFKKV